jgi:hypothetical protein
MTGFKTGNSPNFIQSNFGRSLLKRLDSHGLDFAASGRGEKIKKYWMQGFPKFKID